MSSHSLNTPVRAIVRVVSVLGICGGIALGDDLAPRVQEQQLPYAMHSQMSERPTVRVGHRGADMNGTDHRVLQAAVDYVAALGGGVVEIGEGEYLMGDSLHLRSDVTVRGQKGKTILRKADAAVSPLALDGDFGEQQVTVKAPAGFAVGAGIAIWDDHAGGFHITVARITGRNGNTFSLDTPLMADYMAAAHATAATVYPVVGGSEIRSARVEDLVIEGNKGANPYLDGCRGAGIYLYHAFGAVIQGCVVRNYHGDGISFQQSNDVTVTACVSEDNTHLGLHPGSGSQRPVVRDCLARRNGTDGLFLCWRVRHGVFEDNRLEENGRFGISIGHKDSDNLLRGNRVLRNGSSGVFFRDESAGMSPHRNRVERNVIEDNGRKPGTAGIQIRGKPDGLVLEGNAIR
ncbi:MAG: right-handed parallel beta-helix repeat-containing protein, partial [Thermoplasmata archaeon]|nr:right-handed parallel beta-helix repeat-containing protein [Thermoplasmata archaeon]